MPAFQTDRSLRRNHILFDGREDDQGRALLTISALYFAVEHAMAFKIRYIDVENPAVGAAVEALRWDTGLDVSCVKASHTGPDSLEGARLYVSVVRSEPNHRRLDDAATYQVPILFARQFIAKGDSLRDLLLVRSAHDPVRLASELAGVIGSP